MADLSLLDKFEALVFRWLDSYAGLNLIRFNGTCDQTLCCDNTKFTQSQRAITRAPSSELQTNMI